MRTRNRSIVAFLGTLALSAALHAAPPPPGGATDQLKSPIQRRERQEAPPPQPLFSVVPSCTTGPVPQLQYETPAVYFHVGWAAVPGATEYVITRNSSVDRSPVRVTPPNFNPAPSPTLLEYWDHPTEIRVPQQYTVTAVQPDGCTGSATVTVGPFTSPNPPTLSATRATVNSATLLWPRMRGATFYRVDGPGIPNTGVYLRGDTYTPGQMPTMLQPEVGSSGTNLTKTFPVGPEGGEFHVTAVYPDTADYNTPARAIVPALRQCSITRISPTSGTRDTHIIVTGNDFTYASNLSFVSADNKEHSMPFTANSPTTITATTLIGGYVKVQTPAGACMSNERFQLGSQSMPSADVLVPGVVGLSYNGARQVLQNAGFNPVGVSGPAVNSVVQTQNPQGGARAPRGSTVNLTTVGLASGYSKITLTNNMSQQRGVNVWLFDQATGAWSGGSSVGFGSTTTLNLSSGRMYSVFALDPTKCGGQNNPNNSACEYWRNAGVPGDSNGPTATIPIN